MDFFNELLTNASRYDPKLKNNSIWIKCPFHGGGNERTASCRVNIVKGKYPAGFFYCYGCGAHGNWNKLADIIPGLTRLSEEEIKNQDLMIVQMSEQQKNSLLGTDESIKMDLSLSVEWDRKEIWRKINGQLLHDIGARKFYNKKLNLSELFLPCYQNGEMKGGIKAVLERLPGQKGYFNTPGPWVKKSLFPYDYVKSFMKERNNMLALVEGPRDALNLIQGGIPALAILGSKNWSNVKKNYIELLDPNILIYAFDEDEAGISAFNTVFSDFSTWSNTIRLQFEDGKDPGDLSIKEIKIYYKKLCQKFNL